MIFVEIFFLLAGSLLCFTAALGIYRLPDLYTRQHASTIAGTLGVGMILAAVAIHFHNLSTATLCLATITFLMATTPVSSHLLAIGSYRAGVKLSDRSKINEL